MSLDGNEYLIPGVPIEIPSLTPIVLKINGRELLDLKPFLILIESSFRCILHGFPS